MSSKPWRTDAVILLVAAQFLCFFGGAIAIAFLHKLHIYGFRTEMDFGYIIVGTLCLQGATCVLIPIFLRMHEVKCRDVFGLHVKGFFHSVILAVIALVIILPVALWLNNLSQTLFEKLGWHWEEQEAVKLISGADTLPMKIYLGCFAVVMAPVAEEFIFRGVLYPFIKQWGFPNLALIVTSVLFAAIHGSFVLVIPLFLLAVALTWLYEKTGNLLAPVFAHSLFNSANLVILVFGEQIENWLKHHA